MATLFTSLKARLAGSGLLALLAAGTAFGQSPGVGIGTTTPNGAAALDITSTRQGLLPPRLTTAQRDAITATGLAGGPALGAAQAGLQVYNTTTNQLNVWDGTQWVLLLGQGFSGGTPAVFATTGSPVFYTVPAGVTRLRVVAIGGVGGAVFGNRPLAQGTRVAALLAVVPGEVLEVRVAGNGADGSSGAGGYNGGGSASDAGTDSGGGGGASDVRRAVANGPTGDYLGTRNALVVAAGGGGAYGDFGSRGGQGGAANGNPGTTGGSGIVVGGGATQSGPGTAGTNGQPGTNGNGGSSSYTRGGGGGGGYYGGGGGASNGEGNGGGSGSSWAAASASGVVYSLGGFTPSVTLTPEVAALNAPLDAAAISNLPGTGLAAGAVPFSNGTGLTSDAPNFSFDNATNRLGIGTAAPQTTLDVAGTTRTAGLQLTGGTPGLSKVLTSDATGNATWQPPTATDNLGNHLATQELLLGANRLSAGTATAPGTSWLRLSNAPLATATVQTAPLLRLERNTTSGVKYSNVAEWALGSYGTGVAAQTRLDLTLNNGNVQEPDVTVLSALGNGSVGIGTTAPNGAAALDLSSTTKGLLAPRLSTAQRDAMTATGLAGGPALGTGQAGLQVYNTSTNQLNVWDGTQWVLLLGKAVSSGTLNAPIDAATISNVPGAGLAAGAVAFSNGTTLVADAANLTFDNATNRLGIGTASPSARLTVAGSLALPVRNVNQAFNAYTAVFVGADDYFVRSGTSNGETGAARFSYYLPDPAAHPNRVVVISNYGGTPAFVFTQVGGSNLNNRIYDDAGGGSPTQLLAQRRWTLQSDGGTWLVIGN